MPSTGRRVQSQLASASAMVGGESVPWDLVLMEPFGAKGELSEVSEKFGGLDWLDLKPCGLKALNQLGSRAKGSHSN